MNNKALTAFIGSMLAVVAGLYAYDALKKEDSNPAPSDPGTGPFSGRSRRMRMR
jgi:hypothetical protein